MMKVEKVALYVEGGFSNGGRISQLVAFVSPTSGETVVVDAVWSTADGTDWYGYKSLVLRKEDVETRGATPRVGIPRNCAEAAAVTLGVDVDTLVDSLIPLLERKFQEMREKDFSRMTRCDSRAVL